jgi:type IX secretion system PorP/SprF family membrane protein
MKKIITLFSIVIGSLAANAQQDPQFSQYMFNKLFMNPAYAGMKHAACFTVIGRNQWNGFNGAPNSGVFSGDMWLNRRGGAGLTVMVDKLGFESNISYRGAYSFHVNDLFNRGTLGIGLELGGFSKRIGPSGSDQWVATTNWQTDGSIPPQIHQTRIDLGAGLWYQQEEFYIGLSTSHLPANSFTGYSSPMTSPPSQPLAFQAARHYYITGGWNIGRPGDTWQIKPSFMVKSDATITTFDLNAIALFNDRFWFGASYRYLDAVCPMVGFQVYRSIPQGHSDTRDEKRDARSSWNSELRVGFAYDYTTSGLRNYNNGTFELFINYCMPIEYRGIREGHGSERFFN